VRNDIISRRLHWLTDPDSQKDTISCPR
jgi:hypothetical protein